MNQTEYMKKREMDERYIFSVVDDLFIYILIYLFQRVSTLKLAHIQNHSIKN